MKSQFSSLIGKVCVATLSAVVMVGFGTTRAAGPPAGQEYLQIICRKFPFHDPAIPEEISKRLGRPAPKETRDFAGCRWRATTQGLVKTDTSGKRMVLTGRDGLPILTLKGVAAGPDGRLWISTPDGLICFQPDAPPRDRWHYFWGKRYLADNEVLGVAADSNCAWVRTQAGISLIEFQPFDLDRKSALFLERIEQRHKRYGYVADSLLERPGDTSSFKPVPSDNDGLWTALYVAAESCRYRATGSAGALKNARESLRALLRLESITGVPGFPARAVIRHGEYREPGGEWHATPDGEWEWKGDTSSDELAGHFFAYFIAFELLPDESDREVLRPAVARIAGHLLDHGLKLVGYGGRATRWGNYSPEYFRTPEGREEAPLSSLEILSHLRVAFEINGDTKFLDAYHRLIHKLGYVQNVKRFASETPREVNYSDEELAFLAFYPLLQLEDDARLRREYQTALEGLWRRAKEEKNPLWNFIYAAETEARDYGSDDAVETLKRIPLDAICWTVKNSQRADLEILDQRGRFGEKQSRRAIPPDERAVMKWNGNPFQLDGGDGGRSENDGVFFLLPYWLARYHGL